MENLYQKLMKLFVKFFGHKLKVLLNQEIKV